MDSRTECFVCKKTKGLIPYKDMFFCEDCAFDFLYKDDIAFNFILVEDRRNDFYQVMQLKRGSLYTAVTDEGAFDSMVKPYIRERIREYASFCETDPFILTLDEARILLGRDSKWQVL